MEDHPQIWNKDDQWFEKLDTWVTEHVTSEYEAIARRFSGWKRRGESKFDMHSPAYQDMVFFHPFFRRVFFNTAINGSNHEAMVHTYVMEPCPGTSLRYQAESHCGGSANVEITTIRLLLFANGISMLILGVEEHDISFRQALWINEMMRKVYPSSDRQIASGRIPHRMALVEERNGRTELLIEERFERSRLVELRPQLSDTVLGLLHFASYPDQEFEPVLDERMVVSSFVQLDGKDL